MVYSSMAKQLADGLDPLPSIRIPEQIALEEPVGRNKKALLAIKRQKEEFKTGEVELWFEKLSRQERDELAPPNSIMEVGSALQKKSLWGYFEKEVWKG